MPSVGNGDESHAHRVEHEANDVVDPEPLHHFAAMAFTSLRSA